jgi:hypothetical protein
MLGDHPIDVMLLATDLAVAKDFYGDKIGLEIVIERRLPDFQMRRRQLTKSSTGSADAQTKASWRVKDLAAEVTELRSRGV